MLQRAYVEITNVCNLRCSFCPGTKREKKFIDPAEFRVLAEKLRLWTDYLYLHVMGEPLLHPALGEILDECDRLGFRVCVTTNGVLLPARLAERGVPGETIEATAAAARAAVEEATQRALAAPYGGRADALGGVFEEMRQ